MTIVPGVPPNPVDPNDPEWVSYYDPGGTARVGLKSEIDPGGTGAGPVVLAGNDDQAEADAATTLTADGGGHDVSVITATPPAWLDTSGHIIAAGQYQTGLQISQNVSPTTPGDYLSVGFDSVTALVPADGLAGGNTTSLGGVFNVGTADLPFTEVVSVVMPTDATLSVDVTPFITRLAYNAT